MGVGQSVHNHYVVQHKIGQTLDTIGYDNVFVMAPDAGNFGKVQRSVDTRTQEVRAVKHIEKVTYAVKDKVMQEIALMKAVTAGGGHQNIVKFYEYFEEWGHFDLVFEFCANGTIDDAIKGRGINNTCAACYCHQLLSALAYLRQMSILHRDVKPTNVLLKDEYTSMLADFGSACFLEESESLFYRGGTPAFWPPEVDILPKGDGYAFPFDVWTVGVTLYMMLFKGQHPFMDNGHVDQRLLRQAGFDSGMMWVWNAKLVQLLRWLMMPSPLQRVDPEKARNHAWLGSFGFGTGAFSQDPPTKLVPDSHGRWREDSLF